MNQTTLSYMPTEIWDKIYDIKYAMEKKEHNDYHKPLLNQLHEFYDQIPDIHNKYIYFTEMNDLQVSRYTASLLNLVQYRHIDFDELAITDDEDSDSDEE